MIEQLVAAVFTLLPTNSLAEIRHSPPGLTVDLQYTSSNNITGEPLYPKNSKALGDKRLIAALKQAEAILEAQGYGITILDAWRPKEATRKLWNKAVELGLTNYYAPPQIGSSHNLGAAVDIGLHSLKEPQKLLDMPMKFDQTDARLRNNSPEAKKNESILTSAMLAAGFIRHPLECWHFSYPPCEKPKLQP